MLSRVGDGTWFCDKDALNAAAKHASAIGEQVDGQAGFGQADCAAAAAAHNGFRLQGSLRSAVSAWERNLRALAEQITGVGTKLQETADSYHVTDSRSADRFHSLHVK